MVSRRGAGSSIKSASKTDLENRISKLSYKLDQVTEQLVELKTRHELAGEGRLELAREISALREDVAKLVVMSNRWKGGFIALAGLGGVLGWFLSSWESVLYIFRGGSGPH